MTKTCSAISSQARSHAEISVLGSSPPPPKKERKRKGHGAKESLERL